MKECRILTDKELQSLREDGELLLFNNEPMKALSIYELLVHHKPSDHAARGTLVDLYKQLGREREANYHSNILSLINDNDPVN